MLLIDGVKYKEWTDLKETEDLEPMVIEHAQDIFGEQSKYFNIKRRLEAALGKETIPDGFVIVLGGPPQWHIIEVELSGHDLYQHVVPQVTKFVNAIGNVNNQIKIADAMDEALDKDESFKLRIQKITKSSQTYRFLLGLISKHPTLTVIVEKEKEGMRDVLERLPCSSLEIVEFRTFLKEGDKKVHAHLFKPLYKSEPSSKPLDETDGSEIDVGIIEKTLVPSSIKYYYISVPAAYKKLFPNIKTTLNLETDIGEIETNAGLCRSGSNCALEIRKNMFKWYNGNPKVKAGDTAAFTVIQPLRKYHLEIL